MKRQSDNNINTSNVKPRLDKGKLVKPVVIKHSPPKLPQQAQRYLDYISAQLRKSYTFKHEDDIVPLITNSENVEISGISNHELVPKILLELAKAIKENYIEIKKGELSNYSTLSDFVEDEINDMAHSAAHGSYCGFCFVFLPNGDFCEKEEEYALNCCYCSNDEFKRIGTKTFENPHMCCLICASNHCSLAEPQKFKCPSCIENSEETIGDDDDCDDDNSGGDDAE